jgi:hypothetical protein
MKKNIGKVSLFIGSVCVLLSVIVFVYADGIRRWYSGVFFAVLGIVMLVNALRWQSPSDD